jgi:glycogen operon protein
MYLNGKGIGSPDDRGETVVDDHFLLYFNASPDTLTLTLPPEEYAAAWNVVIDTGEVRRRRGALRAGATAKLAGRSTLVLREHTVAEELPDASASASVAAAVDRANGNGTGTPAR